GLRVFLVGPRSGESGQGIPHGLCPGDWLMQQELESYLADHPFLRGLDAAQLDVIADCARFVEFPAGACLFRAGEPARDCFLIRRGHVGVEINDVRQGPVVLQTLGEPSVLGWSWMVPPYRWCFDARAL